MVNLLSHILSTELCNWRVHADRKCFSKFGVIKDLLTACFDIPFWEHRLNYNYIYAVQPNIVSNTRTC